MAAPILSRAVIVVIASRREGRHARADHPVGLSRGMESRSNGEAPEVHPRNGAGTPQVHCRAALEFGR